MKIPFVGQAYTGRSLNVNAQRCVNLYPEIDGADGKNVLALHGTPGLALFATVGSSAMRSMDVIGSKMYVVSFNKFYEVLANATTTEKGTLLTSIGRVSIANNGTQVMIVDGTYGYIYNTSTGTFTQITDTDFPGADTVCFLDGYFVFNKPNTGSFMITGLYDGSTVDALDIATAEADPDNLIAVLNDHRQLWCFGDFTTEVYYNSGNADFPFERIGGAFIEHGLAARWSIAKCDNGIFWLAQSKTGKGYIVKASGYAPQIVSTRAIEYQINTYSTISDAFAYSYIEEGHTFYVITFPTGNATWVYDAATDMWHERAYRNTTTGNLGRHRGNAYAFFNGFHMVGDFENGKIYKMLLNTYTDNGDPIKRVRADRHISDGDMNNLFHSRLQVDMEVGVGLASGQGSNPQAMLDWSDDGGHTWSSEIWGGIGSVSVGGTGEYKKRIVFRRLGQSRDRVYRLTITEPVKVAIIGASLEITKGAA